MTLSEVRDWTERAGIVPAGARSCLYIPEVSLNHEGLRVEHVSLMCPTARGKRIESPD